MVRKFGNMKKERELLDNLKTELSGIGICNMRLADLFLLITGESDEDFMANAREFDLQLNNLREYCTEIIEMIGEYKNDYKEEV